MVVVPASSVVILPVVLFRVAVVVVPASTVVAVTVVNLPVVGAVSPISTPSIEPPVITAFAVLKFVATNVVTPKLVVVKVVNAPVLGTELPTGVSLIAAACKLPAIPAPPSTSNAPEVVDVLAVEVFTLNPVLVTVAFALASS